MNQFEKLRGFITEEANIPYREVGVELGITEGAVKVAVHRLRRRFREVLRDEVAQRRCQIQGKWTKKSGF